MVPHKLCIAAALAGNGAKHAKLAAYIGANVAEESHEAVLQPLANNVAYLYFKGGSRRW